MPGVVDFAGSRKSCPIDFISHKGLPASECIHSAT
ncbi:hypothetical protein LINGRAHAP2_LOCUS22744 [Linum grandiflorum]